MKNLKLAATLLLPIVLAACAEPPQWNDTAVDGTLLVVPESVTSIAAPDQNLETVKIDPISNCFWYLHKGPVEDTFLPLTTKRKNPICAPKPEVIDES